MNVSVVIPTYNGKELLQKHLPAVLASLKASDEVIIVDDASTDNTVEFLKEKYPHIIIVLHEKNMRFAVSCNDGVRRASNDICVLLNNDVSPTKEFLKPLLKHFDDDLVFAVGCLEENDHHIVSGRALGKFTRGMLIHKRAENQEKTTTLWASGGSMACRKNIWLKIGGMDSLFAPAYWEDIDLSYRAMKMGYGVSFEPNAKVFHHHETTNKSVLGSNNLSIISYRNMFIFYWKNITDIQLLHEHLLWLFYHVIVGGVRTHGQLMIGFVKAVMVLPSVLVRRKQMKTLWKRTDKEIIDGVGAT